MKENKKFVIVIEETIVQEFEIIADSAEKSVEIAKEQYRNGLFILAPGEVQFRQLAVVNPEEDATKWCKF